MQESSKASRSLLHSPWARETASDRSAHVALGVFVYLPVRPTTACLPSPPPPAMQWIPVHTHPQALARLEMQVFLVTLLGRFRMGLAQRMGTPGEALDSLRYHLTLSLPGGLWIKAQPR